MDLPQVLEELWLLGLQQRLKLTAQTEDALQCSMLDSVATTPGLPTLFPGYYNTAWE